MSLNNEAVYRVTIKDIIFKLSRNYTPYIDIVTETLDDNKLVINSSYYFTNKSKYISYNQLVDILNKFDIKINEDDILNSLKFLIGKEVYLIEECENKYQILKDYKETSK